MSENTIVITESDGTYQIENNGTSEFALIGILECIIFDLKAVKRRGTANKAEAADETPPQIEPIKDAKVAPKSNDPELRTRIGNAVKAIEGLNGQVTYFDADNATDEQLRDELDALTEQYKRLKSSKAAKK